MNSKIRAIINEKAKRNKHGGAAKRQKTLEQIAGKHNAKITTKPEIVAEVCEKLLLDPVAIMILSGGDGTNGNFLTVNFREKYRAFGKGMQPIEFAHHLNRLTLDPGSGVNLEAIYHDPQGTVNFYADALGTKGDAKKIRRNVQSRMFKDMGASAFPRAYVPVLMAYSKDRPDDLRRVHLMTVYGDALVYNLLAAYYRPKEKGKSPSFLNAAEIIVRGSASIAAAKTLDTLSKQILGSTAMSEMLYPDRFVDEIVSPVEGEVKVEYIEDDTGRCRTASINRRIATLLGTVGMSPYGIQPLWRMPKNAEGFAYFPPTFKEEPEKLNPKDYTFQFLGGEFDPLDVVKAIPKIFMSQKTGIIGMADLEAKKVEIRQDNELSFIADGTRFPKAYNGETVVIEIAYLQPYILLEETPPA